MKLEYQEFIDLKSQFGSMSGFDPIWMPDFLFDFQKALVEWSVQKGRSGEATNACADVLLTLRPHDLFFIPGIARRLAWKALERLIARMASHFSTGKPSIGA